MQRPANVLYRAERARQQQAVSRKRIIAKQQNNNAANYERGNARQQRPKNFAKNFHSMFLEKFSKARLFKMPVRDKRFADVRPLHQHETNAIDYSPILVRAVLVELPSLLSHFGCQGNNSILEDLSMLSFNFMTM